MTANTLLNSREVQKLPAGTLFKAIFVISGISQKSDRNGKPYYDVTATDALGAIEAKVWSDAQWLDKSHDAPRSDDDKISAEEIAHLLGRVVGVSGRVAEYKGARQFNFNKITLLDQEKFPPAAYLPRSPIPLDDLTARFNSLVEECGGEAGRFLRFVFEGELWSGFRDWPAAVSHHHAYANGLLEHTVSVAACAKSMAESMKASGYDIETDTVIAGALLHDIGKLESYKMAPVPESTVEGALLDHIALGYAKFSELAGKFGLSEKLRSHLSHIIISHHGQREYGSPTVPATPEALIVSAADDLDFKIFCWKDAVKNLTNEQPVSAWNNSAQRRFWKK